MKHRKLRIAWSVVWGIAAVLLIGLWVRSYWIWDEIDFQMTSQHRCVVYSIAGHVACNIYDSNRYDHSPQWFHYIRREMNDLVEGYDPLEKVNRFGFGAIFRWQVIDVLAPSWFPILAVTGFAVLPWIHWSKRFTLRTLLIGITMISMVLGLVVWAGR